MLKQNISFSYMLIENKTLNKLLSWSYGSYHIFDIYVKVSVSTIVFYSEMYIHTKIKIFKTLLVKKHIKTLFYIEM